MGEGNEISGGNQIGDNNEIGGENEIQENNVNINEIDNITTN